LYKKFKMLIDCRVLILVFAISYLFNLSKNLFCNINSLAHIVISLLSLSQNFHRLVKRERKDRQLFLFPNTFQKKIFFFSFSVLAIHKPLFNCGGKGTVLFLYKCKLFAIKFHLFFFHV